MVFQMREKKEIFAEKTSVLGDRLDQYATAMTARGIGVEDIAVHAIVRSGLDQRHRCATEPGAGQPSSIDIRMPLQTFD